MKKESKKIEKIAIYKSKVHQTSSKKVKRPFRTTTRDYNFKHLDEAETKEVD